MESLINMKMDAEEAKEQTQPTEKDAPEYPWGLCITLNDDSLEKLGVSELPKIGTKVTIMAEADVTSVSSYQTQGGEAELSVSLQITDMKLGGVGKVESKLYNGE